MSDAYLQQGRRVTLSGSITYLTGASLEITAEDVLSFTADQGVRNGVLVGAAVAKNCSLVLHNRQQRFTRGLSPMGARVQLFLHCGGQEPLAVFYVNNVAKNDADTFLTLSGTDALGTFFDTLWQDEIAYPATLKSIARAVCNQAGFSLDGDFPCQDTMIHERPDWGEISLRGALCYLAQACGCFGIADGAGEISLQPAWQAAQTPYEIFPEQTFKRVYGDAALGPVTGIRVQLHGAGKEDAPLLMSVDETPLDATNSLTIADNPLLAEGKTHTRTLAADLLAAVKGMAFTRVLISWCGDGAVTLGRRIRVWDTQGAYTDACVTAVSWRVDAGFSMQTDCNYQQATAGAGRLVTPSGGLNGAFLQGQINGALLKAESIVAGKLAAGSVTTQTLDAGCVTAEKLAAGVLSADLIAAGSITTEKLAAGSVTAEKLAAGAVSADFIAAGSITADKLAAGLITADSGLIAQGAIGTVQIADGSITDAKIVGLTASKITAGTINAADVNIINLKADNITAGTLNGMVIPVLGSEKIADGAVSGVKIQNGAVNTEKIEDGAVTAAKIVAEAVTADKIAANSVTANKILSGAVTADKIAANAVTADKIAANTITASKLAADVGLSLDLSSNTSLRLAVEDIQVGGENLLPDTRIMESWYARYAESSKPVTIAEDGEGFGVATWAESTVSVGAGLRPGSGLYLPFGPLENQEVTLSFDWKSAAWQDSDALTLVFNVTDETGGTALCSRSMSLALNKAEKWQRVTLTVTLNEDFFTSYTAPEESSLFYIRFNNYRLAGCSIRRIQLEKGNKATDWGPAPSDGASTTAAILNRSGIRLKTGGTFQVDSRNFQIDDEGNVEMTGKVTAESGEVGGWEIAPGSLSSGEGSRHVRLSTEDATYGIWAGAEGAQNAPFRVARDGSVYLTKLYVTDENGNAQAQPVNLRNNYWKVDKAYARAVKTLSVDAATNTLTIELFDGTKENFKKAVVSGVVNLAQAWNNGRLTITTDTEGITLSGDTTALVNGTPQNLLWGGENGAVATFDVTSDKGIVANQMQVDARPIYKNGYNACIDDCTYANNVYRISEYSGGPLYRKISEGVYVDVGSSWVKTSPASNLYAIPQKMT